MKKYTVEVNGTDYEVIIKDSEGEKSNNLNNQQEKEKTSNSQEQTVESVEPTNNIDTSNMVSVEAPMSGSIISIKVDQGQVVEQGETIMTLEAMKMETEISAPVSGEIGAIKVGEGDNCEHGAVIALIKETV